MKPYRLRKGIFRARRVLRIWRMKFAHYSTEPRQTKLEKIKGGSYDDLFGIGSKIEKLMVRTRVPCSCQMCGNPRRIRGEKTVQEIRADEEFASELDEAMEEWEIKNVRRP